MSFERPTGNGFATPAHRAEGPAGAALGITAKSTETDRRDEARRDRFRLQRTAARLVPEQRVKNCLWSVASNASGVHVKRRKQDVQKGGKTIGTRWAARFSGLQTCGSVWACPVCSSKVSETRRRELNDALAAARQQGLSVFLLTLTFAHNRGEALADLLAAAKQAKADFHDSSAWRRLKKSGVLVGTITATELTHGANGWHPHFHVLIFVDQDQHVAREALRLLEAQWLAALNKAGRSGRSGYAFDLQDGSAAGNYVGKWGAAEELTLGSKKEGAGRNPFAILRQAADGNTAAAARFKEYAAAFKGARQLFWTKGLKDRLAVHVVDDQEAAETADTNEDETLLGLHREQWRGARLKGRARLLQAAEQHDDTWAAHDALRGILAGPDDPEDDRDDPELRGEVVEACT